MLEKMTLGSKIETQDLVFSNISSQSVGAGYVYVRGGQVKTTRYGKPFATLYISDIEKNVIPAYVFNIENILKAGSELNSVIGHIAKIDYQENRYGDVGLTLIITKIELCVGESSEHYAKYIGRVEDAKDLLGEIGKELSVTLGRKISLPSDAATSTVIDYSRGKVGGLAEHYGGMLNILRSLKPIYNESDYRKLMGMFFQFILVHCSYNLRVDGVNAAELTWDLSMKIHEYSESLARPSRADSISTKLGDGVLEIINYVFHGVEPTDIFVKAVTRAHVTFKSCMDERVVYATLGISQSGNAGYGKIVRYCDD